MTTADLSVPISRVQEGSGGSHSAAAVMPCAPSDTAVFYKELRVTLATARTLRPSQKQLGVSLNLSMEGGSLVAGSA